MLLDVKNLSIGYGNQLVASGISFHVNEGDFLCIVGENGAGKSTLVKTLLQIVKPLFGEIVFNETSIGYLPQQSFVQKDFPASVYEVVLSGNINKLKGRFFYSKSMKENAKRNMLRMDVWELRNTCYQNLSGGQQQRVLLARALCASEKLLFLDEPIAGLDCNIMADFYELIQKLNSEGVTIIMVSHDMESVVELADMILHIGREDYFFGSKEEYLSSEYAQILRVNQVKEEKYA